jgi:mono/diheme cytochrome c family protein
MVKFGFRRNLDYIRTFLWATAFVSLAVPGTESRGQDRIDFAHDVLPVLTANCAKCHSNGVFKGEFSLETRQELVESGAVEIGSASESDLIARITSTDPDYQMPPEGARLTPAAVEAISRWIDEGLSWPDDVSLKKQKFERSLTLNSIRPPPSKMGSEHPVDRFLEQYFQDHSVTPPPLLNDRQFLRRAKLDLLGQLPTAVELEQLPETADPRESSSFRAGLVDDLLARKVDYANHWISFWNDLLRNDYEGTGYIDGGRKQITRWLHRSLVENKPYDQFVRELINPSEESAGFSEGIKWRGRVNASQIAPLQFSQNISQVFLGINMKCASCHDSFIDDWKLADAYGLAAIIADEPLEIYRCDVPTGNMAISKFVFPNLGEIDQATSKQERLARLAELMTAKENGRFSRTIVNRLWHRLMGRGLVQPVDVMANPAWSEPLLDFLAADFVDSGCDVKHTLRLIATSTIYQSQSVSLTSDDRSESFVFRGVQPKRMTAEQFVDGIWQLTGSGPSKNDAQIELGENSSDQQPPGNSGPELPDQPVSRAALVKSDPLMRSLGRPNREQVVTTRPAELSTLQALDLSNGEELDSWLRQGAIRWIAMQEKNSWSNETLIKNIFVAALSREPTATEQSLLELNAGNLQESVEDVLWMVTMLPEFQFVR